MFFEINWQQKNQTTQEGKNKSEKDSEMFLFSLWLLSVVYPLY
jgi:hypothetical protein